MVPPEWALPVGARKFRAKWAAHCGLWSTEIAVGDIAWPNAAGGYACDPCKGSAAPTLVGVFGKIRPRLGAGKPVNLDLGDVRAIFEASGVIADLKPRRRGDEQAWKGYRAEFGRDLDAEDVLGLAADALEYRFQPNFPTRPLIAVLEIIRDALYPDEGATTGKR